MCWQRAESILPSHTHLSVIMDLSVERSEWFHFRYHRGGLHWNSTLFEVHRNNTHRDSLVNLIREDLAADLRWTAAGCCSWQTIPLLAGDRHSLPPSLCEGRNRSHTLLWRVWKHPTCFSCDQFPAWWHIYQPDIFEKEILPSAVKGGIQLRVERPSKMTETVAEGRGWAAGDNGPERLTWWGAHGGRDSSVNEKTETGFLNNPWKKRQQRGLLEFQQLFSIIWLFFFCKIRSHVQKYLD